MRGEGKQERDSHRPDSSWDKHSENGIRAPATVLDAAGLLRICYAKEAVSAHIPTIPACPSCRDCQDSGPWQP